MVAPEKPMLLEFYSNCLVCAKRYFRVLDGILYMFIDFKVIRIVKES